MIAESAATPFSLLASPLATEIPNNRPKWLNTLFPALARTERIPYKVPPSYKTFPKLYISITLGLVKEDPIPSKRPAIGKSDIGNMNVWPSF